MPPSDSSAVIVARYLKTNFPESYEAFIAEAGLSPDAGNITKGDLTLETLLEEKKTFDISVRFEKLGLEDGNLRWSVPFPEHPSQVKTLPTASNVLSVRFDQMHEDNSSTVLLVTTADRRLSIIGGKTGDLQISSSTLHDSPILSCTCIRGEYLLTTSMSGQLQLSNMSGETIEKRRDHLKYVVQVAAAEDKNETFVATAGWDAKVCLYKLTTESSPTLGEPFATIPLATKPEAILFVKHPDGEPILLLSRTDSSFVFYYTVEAKPRLLGKQNLAPHSNAWVAFTPSALSLCPTNPKLLAVVTSSVPHMKLLLVQLLFPPMKGTMDMPNPTSVIRTSILDDGPITETQASQARAALAVADREAAAIQIHCTTMAPQTPYSTPALAWRPDGSGVYVNGDDGAVRGIEASTGKIMVTLRSGHEPGSKVRCLCAGVVDGEEIIVSGGFDQRLVFWRVSPKS